MYGTCTSPYTPLLKYSKIGEHCFLIFALKQRKLPFLHSILCVIVMKTVCLCSDSDGEDNVSSWQKKDEERKKELEKKIQEAEEK